MLSHKSLTKLKQSKDNITFKEEQQVEVKQCLTTRNKMFNHKSFNKKEKKTNRFILPDEIHLNTLGSEKTPQEIIVIEDESTEETYYNNAFMKHTVYIESLNTLENIAKQNKEKNQNQIKQNDKGLINSLFDFLNPFKCGNQNVFINNNYKKKKDFLLDECYYYVLNKLMIRLILNIIVY